MTAPTDEVQTLRHQADALRALLLIMWIHKSDVVLWADDWIRRVSVPPEWLLQASLIKDPDDHVRLCEILSQAEGRTDPERTATDILPLFAREVREHPIEWGDVIASIHRLLQDHLSPLALPVESQTGVVRELQYTVWQFADERAFGHGWYRQEGAHTAIQNDLSRFNRVPVPTFLATLPTLLRFAD